MQLSLKVAMALSIFASTNLYAATTLVVPEDVKLLAVNMMERIKLSSNINLHSKLTKTLRQFTVT